MNIDERIRIYRDGLLEDTLPFWTSRCQDREHGGFLHCLGRDGSVIDTDKGVWIHGRFTWLLSTLYSTVEPRPEWLDLAKSGIEFLRRHAFDDDGRMFFILTREGKPLRKRRYVFSEVFGAMAFAAYGKAASDEEAIDKAKALFDLVDRHEGPPKVDTETRPMKGLAMPMCMLAMAQVLRDATGDDRYTRWIDNTVDEVERDFMKPELEAVLETVGPEGELIDHFDGRTLNPGHAIEAAWFILNEAKLRGNDPRLIKVGTTMLDWMWKRGWDEEYGGILYFRDVMGLPVQEYWQDMKFWWPHNEAIIATLLAYHLTGNQKYADWHDKVHDWAYAHFPDTEHGEWFGYLHRDGRVSVDLKGNMWKGPFHLPRMQLTCWKLLEEMKA